MKKIIKTVAVALIYIICIAPCCFGLSKIGSRGEEVRKIQNALVNRGYYIGAVDGIFGTRTEHVLKHFQKHSGLVADGIAGPKTLKALGINSSSTTTTGNGYSSADYELLARLISAEARGEPYIGQVAVGAVVLNRVAHPSFPGSISGVVYQAGAFSCLYDGQFYEPVADSCYSAARDALNGMDPSGNAIYYYNPVTATNKWIRSRPVITTIGKHVFCS